MNQIKAKRIDTLIALLGTIVVSVLIAFFFDFYYDMNDDVLIKDILSGAYSGSPSGYNVQMLFPLSFLISLFYRIFPEIQWYGFFLCACHILCGFLIAKRMIEVTHKYWKKFMFFIGCFALIIILFLWELVYVQYTVTSALLMSTAAYWFYTTDYNMNAVKFLKHNVISIFLVLLSFCIRSEMSLILTPLLCAVGFFRWVDATRFIEHHEKIIDGKKNTRLSRIFTQENRVKYLSLVVIVAIGMFVLLFTDKLAYRDKEWRDFISLFNSRTEVYDFLGIPDYDQNKEIYETVGLSGEQQILLENYNYILDNKINTDFFKRMETVLSDGGKTYFIVPFNTAIRSYLYRISHKVDVPYIYYVWLGYFIMFISALMLNKKSYFWKLPMLFAIRSALWMFLIMRDRLPDRITHSMYVMELLILMAMILSEIKCFKSSDKALYKRFWPITVLSVSLIIGAGAGYKMLYSVYDEQVRRSVQNKEWQAMQTYCDSHPENFYLLDVYSTVVYSEKMFGEADHSLTNYNLAGGWICKSPLESIKLSKFNISNVEYDFLHNDQLLFIAYAKSDISWLMDYYYSKGIYVSIEKVDVIPFETAEGFYVYEVKKQSYKKNEMIYHVLYYNFNNYAGTGTKEDI